MTEHAVVVWTVLGSEQRLELWNVVELHKLDIKSSQPFIQAVASI